ncbi:MAG: CaiB/BaiF CoA transferase family protein [Candidatus Binataceae bacterium]
MKAPLEGIRVVDWTIWQQGPYSTALLADLGAEVIKVEEQVSGDPGRGLAAAAGSEVKAARNFYLESNNRHKKSVAVNLRHPEGREIVYKLVEKSDVFVQNFRKGVAGRLGLDYETLRKRNPKLIYGSATGYGPLGPDSGEPSFDYLGQSRSGLLYAACGPRDMPPTYIVGGLADQMGAIMLSFGIMTALLVRERTGVGQAVDASHLGSMMALQGLNISSRLINGKEMGRYPRENSFNPLWNHYKCKDDKWLCLGMLQGDKVWKDFCKAMGLDHLGEDPRFAQMAARGKNSREMIKILDETFIKKPREEWMKILHDGGDFIFTVVNSIGDLENDPQVIANNYIVDYDHPIHGMMKLLGMTIGFSETPGNPKGRAPEHGEHTETVLTELLDYSWEDVGRLRDAGAI